MIFQRGTNEESDPGGSRRPVELRRTRVYDNDAIRPSYLELYDVP